MPRTTQTTDSPSRLTDCNSLLFSGVVHFAALIALGLSTAASPDSWRGVQLVAHAGEQAETSLDDEALIEPVELLVAADEAAVMGPVHPVEDTATAASDFVALAALWDTAAVTSGLEGPALGSAGQADGSTVRAATQFFGIGGYGQSFVYVVDCSDSMNERGKFDRARYELLQSIEQLASDQRYFVIFFNDGPHPMDADQLVQATRDQVARTAEWVAYIQADGGTNPLPALLFALSLRPDAIYFLSDGQFDPGTKTQLRYRNRPNRRLRTRAIPIHTIAFMDRATERLMRAISRDSGGEYRFVK
jgi:hypothetical protein